MGKRRTALRSGHVDREKHFRALELYVGGLSYRDVGERLSVSHETARQWVQAAEAVWRAEHTADLEAKRGVQAAAAWSCYQAARQKGDIQAAVAALRHLAKIEGTESPIKVGVGVVSFAAALTEGLEPGDD